MGKILQISQHHNPTIDAKRRHRNTQEQAVKQAFSISILSFLLTSKHQNTEALYTAPKATGSDMAPNCTGMLANQRPTNNNAALSLASQKEISAHTSEVVRLNPHFPCQQVNVREFLNPGRRKSSISLPVYVWMKA